MNKDEGSLRHGDDGLTADARRCTPMTPRHGNGLTLGTSSEFVARLAPFAVSACICVNRRLLSGFAVPVFLHLRFRFRAKEV